VAAGPEAISWQVAAVGLASARMGW